MIANLKVQWQQETIVDFSALQEHSDSSQDRVVMVLLQLQQRIIMKGPIENMRPPPLFWDPNAAPAQNAPHMARQITDAPHATAVLQSRGYTQDSPSSQYHNAQVSSPQMPSNGSLPPLPAYKEPLSPTRGTTFSCNTEEKLKPTKRTSLFGRKRKDPVACIAQVEHVAKSYSDAPFVPQYLLPAIHGNQTPNGQGTPPPSIPRASTATSTSAETISDTCPRVESLSTRDGSPHVEADQAEYNPWLLRTMIISCLTPIRMPNQSRAQLHPVPPRTPVL